MIITLDHLYLTRFSNNQITMFKDLFGEKVEATKEACLLLAANEFNFERLANKIFLASPRLLTGFYDKLKDSDVEFRKMIQCDSCANAYQVQGAVREYRKNVAIAFYEVSKELDDIAAQRDGRERSRTWRPAVGCDKLPR